MRTRKAMGDFLEAKQDLSPHTLKQYSRALSYLDHELLEKHLQHPKKSSISVEVTRECVYKSVLGKTPLKEAGFSPAQRRAPDILISMHAPDGSAAGYQKL
jgi:hypothetical protein